MDLPKDITVEQHERELLITKKWFSPETLYFIIYSILLIIYIIWFLPSLFSKSAGMNNPMSIISIVFTLVCVFFIYRAITGFVNKTVVKINKEQFSVIHGPLPCFLNNNINSQEIKYIYCFARMINRTFKTTVYDLGFTLKDGRRGLFLFGFKEKDHALYVKKQIKNFLDIEEMEEDSITQFPFL
ncbi:MAG TPA: hypothetical protein PL110_17490 [Candidatus Eremiobacteraeota bacterium]|nr:MAG: hypothetical protein BWY64_02920 [bacterium ADurb.Bin363]HPZ09889.1 hypothetical protein [Candidatus Eremiobacteraeota bacterium]